MGELLKCTDLSKSYGSTKALKNINLSIESGRIVGLLGPNGSGKTTLIKILNGLLQPTSGTVTIDNNQLGIDTKRIVAYLPDTTFLTPWMTVEQTVNMFDDFFDDFRKELAFTLLEKLGINKTTKNSSLSKGNKEKVCLILIVSRKAKLYVLDEPIAGVDPAARDYIISTILNNSNKDATIIISTHLISDIESILDDVIFIQNGEITLQRSASSIREEGKTVDELFREVYKW
ncbi:MAG: ABC transporter ATP-binding protein [Clostridia bacterium]|nr:ABC transporter ATP-binding protein [Clostridia bacterium]